MLTVKIAGKWSGKVNILRACPRHTVFSVSQKSPKVSSLTTPMALPAPTQLSYFNPTNFNLNSEFHSLRFKIEIAETQKSNRRARVKGTIFDRNRERKERGRVQFSRVWRVGFGIDPEEGGSSVSSGFVVRAVQSMIQYSILTNPLFLKLL